MSKLNTGNTDRKGEGESDNLHMITPQVGTPAPSPSRSSLATPGAGHSFIVSSQHPAGQYHDMKSFKLARPIAPAPPQQGPGIAGRSVQVSQPSIPSIIPPALAQGPGEGLASLNLVTTSTVSTNMGTVSHHPISVPVSTSLGTVSHHPISVPVPLSQQASVVHLGSASHSQQLSMATASATLTPSVTASALPINVVRGAGIPVIAPPPQSAQLFPQGFGSHLPRGTTTLSVPKSSAMVRQGPLPSLQIPAPVMNTVMTPLPLPRGPFHQTIKTNATQMSRPQSPAVGTPAVPQVQPQDLSRANFPMHGSITPISSGGIVPHPMHITLKGMSADTSLHSRTLPGQVQVSSESTTVGALQRISVTLPSDSSMQQRLTPADWGRSSLAFAGQAKVTPNMVSQAKMITSQPLAQHVTAMKSVNLPVSTPVMISSINPLVTATTTIVSCAPIPVAKVTPQRQLPLPLSGLPISSASILAAHQLPIVASSPITVSSAQVQAPSSLSTLSSTSLTSSQGYLHTSSPIISTISSSTPGTIRPEQAAMPTSQTTPGAIIISSDFQSRPPGSVIAMSSMASTLQGAPVSIVSQNETRTGVIAHKDSLWLPQLVYQQVSQNPLIPQSTPAIVGPPGTNTYTFVPSQGKAVQPPNQTLSATHLAQAMSVASSTGVRFNSSLMGIDHMRQQQQQQQQLSLHSSFSTSSTITTATGDKTILAPHEMLFNPNRTHASSGLYTTSIGVQSQMPSNATGLSSVPVSNPSSSPRPSILRKRNSEAAGIVVKKPIFNLNQENRCHSPPRLLETNITNISSPKTPVKNFSPTSENSQSSTDTALSSNDAHTPTHNHNDKGKGDGDECVENGPSSTAALVNHIPASPAVSNTGSLSEASPRKRARKQSLHANEELKDNISSSDEEMDHRPPRREDSIKEKLSNKPEEKRGEYTDKDGVRWVLTKPRSNFVLIQSDNVSTKTKSNHFHKYSDVKPKDERRPTVNELANQRGIMQKVNGWKLYFSASQLEELMDMEKDMQDQFRDVQAALSQLPMHRRAEDEATKIHEMSQANIQRCQLIQNQLTEARANMIKTLEHKPRIQEIVNKHMSKRPIKKKERT